MLLPLGSSPWPLRIEYSRCTGLLARERRTTAGIRILLETLHDRLIALQNKALHRFHYTFIDTDEASPVYKYSDYIIEGDGLLDRPDKIKEIVEKLNLREVLEIRSSIQRYSNQLPHK